MTTSKHTSRPLVSRAFTSFISPDQHLYVHTNPCAYVPTIEGVPQVTRRNYVASKPTLDITATSEGQYTLTESTMKGQGHGSKVFEVRFADGQEDVEWRPHGIRVRSDFAFVDGGVLEERQVESSGHGARKLSYEVDGDELRILCWSRGVRAMRVFTREWV